MLGAIATPPNEYAADAEAMSAQQTGDKTDGLIGFQEREFCKVQFG